MKNVALATGSNDMMRSPTCTSRMGLDTPDSIVTISDPAKQAGLLLLGLATGADVGDKSWVNICCAVTLKPACASAALSAAAVVGFEIRFRRVFGLPLACVSRKFKAVDC